MHVRLVPISRGLAHFTIIMLNTDISCFDNNVDLKQLGYHDSDAS